MVTKGLSVLLKEEDDLPYRYALAKQLKYLSPEHVRTKNEQLKKLYAEHQAQRVATNCARWAEFQQEASDRDLANIEADICISAATRQLEAAKVEAYKIVTVARSSTQQDVANRIKRKTTPCNKLKGQLRDNARQPANLHMVENNHFASESDDRPLPPHRETYVECSVVDHVRQPAGQLLVTHQPLPLC